jgi:bifunctional ADP-heptose synthase (sugar kinase/adenylyltransferase)
VDKLVVGVVSDDGTEAYKHVRPFRNQDTRLRIIHALRCVDFALPQETTDPTPVLRALRPHVLFHGDDWSALKEGNETLAELGIEFVLLPYTPGVCSTDIRAELAQRPEVDTVPIDVIPMLVRRSMDGA